MIGNDKIKINSGIMKKLQKKDLLQGEIYKDVLVGRYSFSKLTETL
jgi:hypothetical protein